MAMFGWSIIFLVFAVFVGVYQFYVVPVLDAFTIFRVHKPLNNFLSCTTVPELQACEKIVLHQPSGKLFLACSTPESRTHWTPATDKFEAEGRSTEDYVAIYDPKSKEITRLTLDKFNSNRGLSVHGMDVVPSSSNPNELFVYMVNHRPPQHGDPKEVGADSAIEIFKTTLTSGKLTHIKTVEDPSIITPNDVTGYPDGKSFYFTNDHAHKILLLRVFREFFNPAASVGFCHVEDGCKLVAKGMRNLNGITQAPNGTIYVASTLGKTLRIFDRQEDNSIVLTDVIPCETSLDNLSIDTDGVVWGAGFPNGLIMAKHMQTPSIPAPSVAWKFGINTGPSSFYGEKFKVERAFEDSGDLAMGSTTVVHDAQRGLVFMHGIVAPWLTVCRV
ncbi:serum paraoxonase/arylesterase [Marasmius fiardii PR-910]|nr:serum paraoxonase/arylesterase [Marasmius fiardii PR-910]